MKRIYNKIKNKLILKTLPKVKNFKEAELYCKNKNTLGYESKLLCKYRYDKLEKHIKKNGSTLLSQSRYLLIYCILYYLKNNKGKVPKIIDFGGACGENIIFLKTIFGNDILKTSWVIETKAQVNESHNYRYSKEINFSDDLKKVLKENNIDIFFSSCALNYIQSPYKILSIIEDYKIPMVCLTRNNFSKKPKSFVQVSNLSDNGFGEHIEKYGNPKIWYPSQSLSEEKIKHIFSSAYDLILDESINKSGIINKNENYAKDLIFNIK